MAIDLALHALLTKVVANAVDDLTADYAAIPLRLHCFELFGIVERINFDCQLVLDKP